MNQQKQERRSGALAQMGAPAAPQTAVGIVADQEKEKIQQPLAAGTFCIARALTAIRHIKPLLAQKPFMTTEGRILLKDPRWMQVQFARRTRTHRQEAGYLCQMGTARPDIAQIADGRHQARRRKRKR